MPDPSSNSFEPIIIQGSAGAIFAIYYPPAFRSSPGPAIIHIPAFAEEMNCARRMVALQARRFAETGTGTLLIDPYGTGDSAGDFVEARWNTWLDDIVVAAAWLRARGHRDLGLWGLRLGGLLAAQAAAQDPRGFARLLLWQPVLDGKAMLTQFLRIRVAQVMGGGADKETTSILRGALAAGHAVEVAGYDLSPELAAAIDSARLEPFVPSAGTRVDWIEVTPQPSGGVGPASERILAAWRAAGVTASAAAVPGQPFWAIQETVLVPELLDATARVLEA